jgi:hypothetical protein
VLPALALVPPQPQMGSALQQWYWVPDFPEELMQWISVRRA